jgi:hypothetical protein
MALAAVFLVSLSSLGYEILLPRYFSFTQWNHLSFMVISIVMFGYAASGAALSVVEPRSPGRIRAWLSASRLPLVVLAYCAAVAGSYLLVQIIPLDYFRIPLEAVQAAYLLATYLGLLVPFTLAGTVVGLAFAGRPDQSGLIYGASMLGSAAGAVLAALLLPLLGEGRLAVVFALVPLLVPLAAPLGSRQAPGESGRRGADELKFVVPGALLLALGALLVAGPGAGWLAPRPSPYKLLAQALQFPDAHLTATEITLRARIDTLETPYLRFAPGLSLKYQGPLPERKLLVRDGDELFVLMDLSDPAGLQFARYTHSFAAYELAAASPGGSAGPVLVLLQGGGLSLACSAAHGRSRITVLVEPGPVARALRGMAPPAGGALDVRQGSLRLALSGCGKGYGVVQIEAWGASIPGTAALSEEPLLTVEALGACLERLSPDGILSVSRRLLLPPSDSVRLFAAAAEALRGRGVSDPGRHILALLRRPGGQTAQLLRGAQLRLVVLPGDAGGRGEPLQQVSGTLPLPGAPGAGCGSAGWAPPELPQGALSRSSALHRRQALPQSLHPLAQGRSPVSGNRPPAILATPVRRGGGPGRARDGSTVGWRAAGAPGAGRPAEGSAPQGPAARRAGRARWAR